MPPRGCPWALHALLLLASGCALAAAAATCPELPPAPDGTRRFALSAGALSQPSPWQALAYNDSRGWGPEIRVALGETVQVDVTNDGIEEGTTVHWHGQHLGENNWADGSDGLTQAAIPPGATFSYRFVAGPAGTHWYHAHTGAQFGSGLRGPLVVTDPSDPAAGLYDEELTLLLADVFESTTGDEQLAELRGGAHSMAACPGLDLSDVPWGGVEVNGRSFATTGAAAVLRVKSGRRYRVRALSGASSWALRLAVAGHNVSVVAVDGAPIAPAPAASFVLASGQRADFILTADQPPANYWVNVSSLNGHVAPAILHYEDGAPDPATDPAVAPTAYEPRVGCPADPAAAAAADLDLAAVQAGVGVEAPPQEADRQLTVYLVNAAADAMPPGFKAAAAKPGSPYGLSAAAAAELPGDGEEPACADGSSYCWALNWNQYEMPPSLLVYGPDAAAATQAAAAPQQNGTEGAASAPRSPRTFAVTVQPGETVDVLLLNPRLSHAMPHPMHLHGGAFWLLAAGQGAVVKADGTIDWEAPSLKKALNLKNPPLVDTVAVPQAAGGVGGMGGMSGMGGGGAADPHAGHSMGGSGGDSKSKAGPALQSADSDPHAGHNMARMAAGAAQADPHAGHHRRSLRAAADPHAGHNMGGGGSGGGASSTKAADPHAGHDMGGGNSGGGASSTKAADPHAGHDMGGGGDAASAFAADATPGFALVRARFDRPGLFAFHCHVDAHMGSGMMMHFVVPGWSAPAGLQCGQAAGPHAGHGR